MKLLISLKVKELGQVNFNYTDLVCRLLLGH